MIATYLQKYQYIKKNIRECCNQFQIFLWRKKLFLLQFRCNRGVLSFKGKRILKEHYCISKDAQSLKLPRRIETI